MSSLNNLLANELRTFFEKTLLKDSWGTRFEFWIWLLWAYNREFFDNSSIPLYPLGPSMLKTDDFSSRGFVSRKRDVCACDVLDAFDIEVITLIKVDPIRPVRGVRLLVSERSRSDRLIFVLNDPCLEALDDTIAEPYKVFKCFLRLLFNLIHLL